MGRKEHILKSTIRENAQAKQALLDIANSLNKIQSIADNLKECGLKYGSETLSVGNICAPTLASILKDCGFQVSKGRRTSKKAPLWASIPAAIDAIKEIVDSKGIAQAVEHLNSEGITFGNTKITFKEENTLSVTTLTSVLNKGKKSKSTTDLEEDEKEDESSDNKTIKDKYDFDEDEDEDEDEEDFDEDVDF